MRILMIAGADQQYGTFHMTQNLLEFMAKMKKNVTYIVITQKKGALNEWCDNYKIENYVIPYQYVFYYPSENKVVNRIKHILKYITVTLLNHISMHIIEKNIDLRKIDIVHTNNNRDIVGMMISKKYRIPNITYLREFSRIHFHLLPIYHDYITYMNKYTQKFIAISKAVQKDWVEYGADKEKTCVIYDGINCESIQNRSKDLEEGKLLRIIMCGAIYEGKGQLDLIKSVTALVKKEALNIRVDLYGKRTSSDYLNIIERYIRANDMEEFITIKGYSNDLNRIICNYNVGVVNSIAEGFGLSTVEYMVAGLCVVAVNTGANVELIGNNEYGIIYRKGNIEELTCIIRKLYNYREAICYFGNKARQYAMQNYTVQSTINKVNSIYQEIENTKGIENETRSGEKKGK